jgi:hypothetical protein
MCASDDDRNEYLLMDDLCLQLVQYSNALVLLFQYLPEQFNFSRISSQLFGLRSLLWYFLSLWSQNGRISLTSSYMLTAAGVWPDSRLERYLFYWARNSGVVRDNILVRSVLE